MKTVSEFEQQIWDDFWTVANDPAKSAELGIRSAHGTAVSIRVQPGKTYQIDLRATGDFTFRPVTAESDADESEPASP